MMLVTCPMNVELAAVIILLVEFICPNPIRRPLERQVRGSHEMRGSGARWLHGSVLLRKHKLHYINTKKMHST